MPRAKTQEQIEADKKKAAALKRAQKRQAEKLKKEAAAEELLYNEAYKEPAVIEPNETEPPNIAPPPSEPFTPKPTGPLKSWIPDKPVIHPPKKLSLLSLITALKKWQYIKYLPVGVGVLVVVLLLTCNKGKNSIVEKNDKAIAPHLINVDSLKKAQVENERVRYSDSVARVAAMIYANEAHEEVERMKIVVKNAQAETERYLQNQKKSSDENKQVIRSGSLSALDSLWQRVKLTNGYTPRK